LLASWSGELNGAIGWIRNKKPKLFLSDEAREIYSRVYLSEWSKGHSEETVEALMERAPTMSLRIAMTLALMDKSPMITAAHINCAVEWSRYWRASVEYVWRDRVRLSEGSGAADIVARARKIYLFLRDRGGPVLRTEIIRDCFGGNLRVADIDPALEYLEQQVPPLVRKREEPKRGRGHQTAFWFELIKTPQEHDECDETAATTRAASHSAEYEPDESEGKIFAGDKGYGEFCGSPSSGSSTYESDADRATAAGSSHSSHSGVVSPDDESKISVVTKI
jgi:hypothetical protein